MVKTITGPSLHLLVLPCVNQSVVLPKRPVHLFLHPVKQLNPQLLPLRTILILSFVQQSIAILILSLS